MKRRQKSNDESLGKQKDPTTKPKIETGTPISAGQILRDRLNKLKSGGQGTGVAGARGNSPTNMRNRFQNTPPRNISQKSRKGLRPG